MSKNKKGKANCFSSPLTLDYQKLASAIVEAEMRAREYREAERKKEQKKIQEEWNKIINYKEYPLSNSKIVNWLHSVRNGMVVFFKILTLKKEDAKFDVATTSLMRLALNAIFAVIKWVLYILAFLLVASSVYSFEQKDFVEFKVVLFIYAVLSFTVARIFRVAQFEVDHIEERDFLTTTLSVATSFFAMVLAILALFVK